MNTNPRRFPVFHAWMLLAALALAAQPGFSAPASKSKAQGKPPAVAAHADSMAVPPSLTPLQDTLALKWVGAAVLAHGGRPPREQLRDLQWTATVTQHGRGGMTRVAQYEESIRVAPAGWSLRLAVRNGPASGSVFVATPDTDWAYEDSVPLINRRALTFPAVQLALERTLLEFPWAIAGGSGAHLTAVPDTTNASARIVDAILPNRAGLWRIGFDPGTSMVASVSWWHGDLLGAPEYRVELSGYQEAGGLQLATQRRIFEGDSRDPAVEYALTGLRVNSDLPDSLFRKR